MEPEALTRMNDPSTGDATPVPQQHLPEFTPELDALLAAAEGAAAGPAAAEAAPVSPASARRGTLPQQHRGPARRARPRARRE